MERFARCLPEWVLLHTAKQDRSHHSTTGQVTSQCCTQQNRTGHISVAHSTGHITVLHTAKLDRSQSTKLHIAQQDRSQHNVAHSKTGQVTTLSDTAQQDIHGILLYAAQVTKPCHTSTTGQVTAQCCTQQNGTGHNTVRHSAIGHSQHTIMCSTGHNTLSNTRQIRTHRHTQCNRTGHDTLSHTAQVMTPCHTQHNRTGHDTLSHTAQDMIPCHTQCNRYRVTHSATGQVMTPSRPCHTQQDRS